MLLFLARRILNGVVLIFVVTMLTFALIFAGGTDIARNILGSSATQEQVEARAAEMGLDRPLMEQYTDWLLSALQGDWGASYLSDQPVVDAMATRIPVTMSVVLCAVLLTALLSAVLGVAAAKRGGMIDRSVQILSVIGFALPGYWIALVLVLLVALPFSGGFAATGYVAPERSVVEWLGTITLPVLALTINAVAGVAQQVRGAMLDVMRQDYIRTLRSRGISERAITYRHALRNAAAPALTVLSLQFVGMLGGAVVIERVFALPGLGSLVTDASLNGDIPIVMGVVTFMVGMVVLVNLLIDVANGWLNPKARTA